MTFSPPKNVSMLPSIHIKTTMANLVLTTTLLFKKKKKPQKKPPSLLQIIVSILHRPESNYLFLQV